MLPARHDNARRGTELELPLTRTRSTAHSRAGTSDPNHPTASIRAAAHLPLIARCASPAPTAARLTPAQSISSVTFSRRTSRPRRRGTAHLPLRRPWLRKDVSPQRRARPAQAGPCLERGCSAQFHQKDQAFVHSSPSDFAHPSTSSRASILHSAAQRVNDPSNSHDGLHSMMGYPQAGPSFSPSHASRHSLSEASPAGPTPPEATNPVQSLVGTLPNHVLSGSAYAHSHASALPTQPTMGDSFRPQHTGQPLTTRALQEQQQLASLEYSLSRSADAHTNANGKGNGGTADASQALPMRSHTETNFAMQAIPGMPNAYPNFPPRLVRVSRQPALGHRPISASPSTSGILNSSIRSRTAEMPLAFRASVGTRSITRISPASTGSSKMAPPV